MSGGTSASTEVLGRNEGPTETEFVHGDVDNSLLADMGCAETVV
jgi:hypothetical protein